MTDPTEQTVGEALFDAFAENHVEQGFAVGGIERLVFKRDAVLACIALGIQSDSPMARLREDLAIVARVRACQDRGYTQVRYGTERAEQTTRADTLLGWLLNGDQP